MSFCLLRATVGSLRFRIFATGWILFGCLFATNVVREHYPALALVEDGTYRCDRYKEPRLPGETPDQGGLHSDLFWHAGHAYINNNVGTSVIAALPLLPFKPVLRVMEERSKAALGKGVPDTRFETQYKNRERFYRLARENGWELKLGAVAAITALLLMAPLSALFLVLTFDFLDARGVPRRRAIVLAMLFGFGTPILYRTAHLNHNMMVMYAAFGAFLTLFPRPGRDAVVEEPQGGSMLPRAGLTRHFAAGLLGGAAVMCDYSGAVPALWLGLWTLAGAARARTPAAWARPLLFGLGALVPILVQLHSQWVSFGSWIHPPQTWMADANFTERGYRGLDWPALDLFWKNLFELRWGVFAYGPLLLFGLVPPRRSDTAAPLPFRPWLGVMSFVLAFMLFAAANQYGRMQWNTGVRYLMPVVPFLFLAAANHLARMNGAWLWVIGAAAVLHSWVTSMRRLLFASIDEGLGVLEDWKLFLAEGPRLPWLDVLSRTATGKGSVPEGAAIHVVFLAACLLLVTGIWWAGRRLERSSHATSPTPPGA